MKKLEKRIREECGVGVTILSCVENQYAATVYCDQIGRALNILGQHFEELSCIRYHKRSDERGEGFHVTFSGTPKETQKFFVQYTMTKIVEAYSEEEVNLPIGAKCIKVKPVESLHQRAIELLSKDPETLLRQIEALENEL